MGSVFGVPAGSVSVDRDAVVLAIAAVQVLTLLLQTFWRPAFNPFCALHGLLYAVFRVQGPSSSPSSTSKDKDKDNKDSGAGLLLEKVRVLLLPVAVAMLSAGAQYYLLRYYSAPSSASAA